MMASRMDREVIAWKPTLVIWETGTTDAVRGTELDEFRQTIQAGIDHDKLHLIASRMYDCIGRVVAGFVTRGAHPGTGSPAASSGSDQ